MKTPYKARHCHGRTGSFVYVEPTWNLVPRGPNGECLPEYAHVQISSCFYMSAENARDLAAQLLVAADAADGKAPEVSEPPIEEQPAPPATGATP